MRNAETTKVIDGQGRLVLGKGLAGRHAIVEVMNEEQTEFRVRIARVIPEGEAWLYANKDALDRVRAGLEAAQRGDFVDGPDMDAARAVADAD
jgi:hypothetical protein